MNSAVMTFAPTFAHQSLAPKAPAQTTVAKAFDPETLAVTFSDTYSTQDGHPGQAHVLSTTVDKATGRRNEYALTYCWQPPSGTRTGRFQVLGCTCMGFITKRACRHAIGWFDVLNAAPVAAFLLSVPGSAVLSAKAEGACARCGGPKLTIRLRVPGYGPLTVQTCPACRRSVVR